MMMMMMIYPSALLVSSVLLLAIVISSQPPLVACSAAFFTTITNNPSSSPYSAAAAAAAATTASTSCPRVSFHEAITTKSRLRHRRRCRPLKAMDDDIDCRPGCPCDDDDDTLLMMNNNNKNTKKRGDRGSSSSSSSSDFLEDRREAVFAMLGSIWATTTPASVGFPGSAAYAQEGAMAKIEFPDPIQGMSDRTNRQCLVESLGNRECLVYMGDTDKFLYKGTDNEVLIKRLEKSVAAFSTVPDLIVGKKWSQVAGVMTGPMGELVLTMNKLSDSGSNPSASKKMVQKVKTDLYSISSAATRKDVDNALSSHAAATKDLAAFINNL